MAEITTETTETEEVRLSRVIVGTWYAALETADGAQTPLPPYPHEVIGPVELVVRLRSTRGGRNAWWVAGNEAREAMNRSPYEPMLRAVVSHFSWAPSDTRDAPEVTRTMRITFVWGEPPEPYRLHDYEFAIRRVFQGGSAVLNWTALVEEPLPDPLEDLFGGISGHCIARQGHLKVYEIEDGAVGIERLPRAGGGYRQFYNHLLCNVYNYAWRVLDDAAYAIARFGRMGAIVSDDHPEEPITLHGLYLLRHPVPVDREVD